MRQQTEAATVFVIPSDLRQKKSWTTSPNGLDRAVFGNVFFVKRAYFGFSNIKLQSNKKMTETINTYSLYSVHILDSCP